MTEPPPAARRGLGASAVVVSAATMLSRVLAVVREQLFASLFGAEAAADAYRVAFRIPNLLRDLFAEGALSAAFVPAFAGRLHRDGRDAAFRLANVVIGAVLVVVGAIAVAGVVAAPGIVHLLAPGFRAEPGKFALTVELARWMMPFLPLVSLAAVAMGQLNAQERYGWPALAAASFNVVAIAAGAALHLAGLDAHAAVVGWSLATVAGGLVQVAIQVPSLRATGFRFRPRVDLSDPDLRRIALLMAPATLGLAATQLNIFVNTSFASSVPGAVSWLEYAFRLMQLPIGVFGVAVATIAATRLARHAAASDPAEMAATLGHGLRLVAFLTVPCTFGLVALAEPVPRLLYQYGRFRPADTEGTGAALVLYALGLTCYSAVKVLAPAWYALGRSRVPLLASVGAVAANLALNFALFPVLGFPGLALGTTLAATVNAGVLAWTFHRGVAPLDVAGIGSQVARVAAASAACGGAAWAAHRGLDGLVGSAGAPARAVAVLGAVAAGVAVYAAACRALRVAELDEIAGFVRAKLGRRAPPAA